MGTEISRTGFEFFFKTYVNVYLLDSGRNIVPILTKFGIDLPVVSQKVKFVSQKVRKC